VIGCKYWAELKRDAIPHDATDITIVYTYCVDNSANVRSMKIRKRPLI
jgi:hypothetical protein